MLIENPAGGPRANVSVDNQLEVHASVATQVHWYSEVKGQSYQVIGTTDTLTAAKVPVLYIKNTSSILDLVLESLVLQTIAEAATIPAVGIFWTVDVGAVVSGGTAIVPVNLNSNAGNLADATALHSTPTIDTAGTEIFKFYPKLDGELINILTQGALILGPNGTATISYTTTGSVGIAHANACFYMETQGAG